MEYTFHSLKSLGCSLPLSAKCYYVGNARRFDTETALDCACKKLPDKDFRALKRKLKFKEEYLKSFGDEIDLGTLAKRLDVSEGHARKEFKDLFSSQKKVSWTQVIARLEKDRIDKKIEIIDEIRENENKLEGEEGLKNTSLLVENLKDSLLQCVSHIRDIFNAGITLDDIEKNIRSVFPNSSQVKKVEPASIVLKDSKGFWDYNLVKNFLTEQNCIHKPVSQVVREFPEHNFNSAVIGRAKKLLKNPFLTKYDLFGTIPKSKKVYAARDEVIFIDKQVEDFKLDF